MAYVATDRISKQRGWVARLWSALGKWRALRVRRQAFLNTRRLDDRMLADIGVTREEVEWAAGLPLEARVLGRLGVTHLVRPGIFDRRTLVLWGTGRINHEPALLPASGWTP